MDSLPEVSGILECGEDFDCFIEASNTCEEADVDRTVTVDIFGVQNTTNTYYRIDGLENELCKFYIQQGPTELVFPEGTDQSIIDEQNEIYESLIGREGECLFETSDLNAMLNEWKLGNFSTSDWDVAECTGEYFSSEL